MLGSDEKRHRTLAAAIPDDLLISEVLVVHLPAKPLGPCSEVDPHDAYATTSGEISFHRLLLPPPEQALGTIGTELIFEKAWPEGITRRIIPTHCDGLVAIATATDHRVFVCNPATREFVALPLGSHNELLHLARCWYFYRNFGEVSFDEATGEWSQDCTVGHEVFTLGGGDSWEATECPPHAAGVQRPVCTRQAFYWHAVEEPLLIWFGLRDRTFAVVPRPPARWSPHDDMADLDGRLCNAHAGAEAAAFHVWLADDRPELQWSLQFRIELLYPPDDPDIIHYMRPVISVGSKMLLAVVGKCSYLFWGTMTNEAQQEAVDLHHEVQYERPDGSKCMSQSQDGS
ncbi:putative F-box/kelch-repeat protein At1g13200 [Setaria viridis]|uniref:putative F-box/kelch-repeat protein At1g13200 n=1 Tax=Setaria viridis TaxID=4556 RepID=UPI001493402C|nr:putative F-box/kelch-repeat protein At1g13200 [Setaria viridis]